MITILKPENPFRQNTKRRIRSSELRWRCARMLVTLVLGAVPATVLCVYALGVAMIEVGASAAITTSGGWSTDLLRAGLFGVCWGSWATPNPSLYVMGSQ
jgi:hypothetical protein